VPLSVITVVKRPNNRPSKENEAPGPNAIRARFATSVRNASPD
jgi:hypothetical protein